ncbi:MAG: hypothetical protein DRI24_16985 [Deltaproteobacteria bacterium]|nr:MAG: hypothetical protein DRI24_16985 [Deltaproteobacteria bacterium]
MHHKTEQETEADIIKAGKTAPRLTPEYIDSCIADTQYHVFAGSQTTVCCVTLLNGFTVIGSSACASPENFDAQIGMNIAFRNARSEIWKLEGYLLKDKLSK